MLEYSIKGIKMVEIEITDKTYLNTNLLKSQGVDADGVEKIEKLHKFRMALEGTMELAPSEALPELFDLWMNGQYKLQDEWHFGVNPDFIRFWDVPRCSCPKQANELKYPKGDYNIDSTCPVHIKGF